MDLSPTALLDIHANIQKGTYFSNIDKISRFNINFAYSKKIDDFYWNYAYNIICNENDIIEIVKEIKNYANNLNRSSVVFITPDTIPCNFQEIVKHKTLESEVWMTLEEFNFTINEGVSVEILSSGIISEEFLEVFEDSYGGGAKDSSGYFGLPIEYIESLKNIIPTSNVKVVHFIAKVDNIPVAISSIYIYKEYAGLYNVGTKHTERSKGYGSEISKTAIKYAFKHGCKVVFLQTKADSAVETLYKNLGFNRRFIGTFINIGD